MSDYGKEASMIPRALGKQAKQLAQWFPVVSITGPRQSGKSTLAKAMFPDYDYVNLENPETRKAAIDDPVGFIRQRPPKLIVDEAQYAPDLFSMIQVASDERTYRTRTICSLWFSKFPTTQAYSTITGRPSRFGQVIAVLIPRSMQGGSGPYSGYVYAARRLSTHLRHENAAQSVLLELHRHLYRT